MIHLYPFLYITMASKMNSIIFLLFSIILILLRADLSCAQDVKGAYWYPDSGVELSDIDSTLFTHLFFAFTDLDPNTNEVVVSSDNSQAFTSFTSTVQKKNPSVKTLMSIGGGGNSTKADEFATMASQAASRKTFIDSSISLARSGGYYGIDLDWEQPDTADKMTNFGSLLSEWRAAVATEAKSSGEAALYLTAAVFYSSDYYSLDFPVSTMAQNLDWINLMAYDFYAPGWSTITRPPAALYNPGNQVSGDNGVTAWINSGMPANKLVLGFPFYGYAWKLTDANNHGFFAPTTGAAISSDGSIMYSEIKTFISQNTATCVYNATVVSDYCYSGTTWIGYDDTQSISSKVSYAKQKGLGGYFAWQAGGDDNWVLSKTAYQAWG